MNKKTIIFTIQTVLLILLSFVGIFYSAGVSERGLPEWPLIEVINSLFFIILLPSYLLFYLTKISLFYSVFGGPVLIFFAAVLNGLIDSLIITGILRLTRTMIKRIN